MNLIFDRYSIDEALEIISNVLKPACVFAIDRLINEKIPLCVDIHLRGSFIRSDETLDCVWCDPLGSDVFIPKNNKGFQAGDSYGYEHESSDSVSLWLEPIETIGDNEIKHIKNKENIILQIHNKLK